MQILKYVFIAVVGYLLGNISVGMITAKAFGTQDIRKHGSGNSGSTNVLRTLGWLPGALTLVGDCLKGYIACMLGRWLCGETGMLLGGFCAVVGHDYPVFMGFKGGKGIATSLAMILAIDPKLGLAHVALVFLVVAVTGYMSLGSILAALAFPTTVALFYTDREPYLVHVGFAMAACCLAIYRHKGNIQRLLKHEENRLDFAKITAISKKVMARMRGKNKDNAQ